MLRLSIPDCAKSVAMSSIEFTQTLKVPGVAIRPVAFKIHIAFELVLHLLADSILDKYFSVVFFRS